MAEIILNAKSRESKTKGELNQLRRDSNVPGVYYVSGKDGVSITVPEIALKPLIYTSEAHVVSLVIDEAEPLQCILKDTQFDPVSERVLHFDLVGLTAGQLLQLQVPVVLIGESIGVQTEGGSVNHSLLKLDIECFPRHIPESLEVNVTELHAGDSVHVGDLAYEDIRILNNANVTVVSITKAKAEEVEETDELAEDAPAEPEVISKGKAEEEE